jgi:hypothetical protein
VPASVVIQALWEDEPRFESPAEAKQLFGNLLALFELVATGAALDLGPPAPPAKRPKAPRPPPFGSAGPDDDFVEAAWRYFDDAPKERARLEHAFDHRQDQLVSWLDAQGRALLSDIHAMLELGGRSSGAVREGDLPLTPELPEALARWIDEGLFEAEQHEDAPLPAEQADRLKVLVSRAATALWRRSGG